MTVRSVTHLPGEQIRHVPKCLLHEGNQGLSYETRDLGKGSLIFQFPPLQNADKSFYVMLFRRRRIKKSEGKSYAPGDHDHVAQGVFASQVHAPMQNSLMSLMKKPVL